MNVEECADPVRPLPTVWRHRSPRRRSRAAAVGVLVASAAVFGASSPPAAASDGGDAAAVRATYAAVNQLWNVLAPAAYCGDRTACLRAAAGGIEEVAEDLVRPLVRALRTATTPCIVSTATEALYMTRLARTGARKSLKGSRLTTWLGAAIDAMYTVQMGANSCVAWGGGL